MFFQYFAIFDSLIYLPATMDKKRSKLWGFFTQVKDDKAKCDLCKSLYSVKGGSTTNLIKHLVQSRA